MPIKRPKLVTEEIYHIISRGTGDTLIFKNNDDYYRGIFSLYEFNTTEPVEIRKQREKRRVMKASGEQFSAARNCLVEIMAFCFMPNHIHLLLRQIKDEGISKFMRKFGAGYGLYFNKKHGRQGHLFQGRFRAVHIKNDNQLRAIFAYIHTNPVSLIEPDWKGAGAENPGEAIRFLESYKWSSYQDYIGKNNFPSLTERNFLKEALGKEGSCKNVVEDWVRYKREIVGLEP